MEWMNPQKGGDFGPRATNLSTKGRQKTEELKKLKKNG